jgi:hypothetical protein
MLARVVLAALFVATAVAESDKATVNVVPALESADAAAIVSSVASTLHEAQLQARQLRAAGHSNVEVLLAPGTHALDEPLRLSAADSGVVWRGAPGAVVSGGKRVGGWRAGAGGTWTAPLPAGVVFSRTLWVNGERRNRTILHGADCCSVHPTSGIFELDGETVALTGITDKGYVGNSSSFLKLENAADIELLYTRVGSSWTEGRCTLQSIVAHASGAELFVKQPCFANQRNKSYNQAVSFPRSLEQISLRSALAPGSWYLDRAKAQVVFQPTAADEALGPAGSVGSVLAAVGTDAASTALLDLDGAAGVRFDAVHFDQGGGWGGASNDLGYTETQAAYHASTGYAPGKFPGFNDSAWVAVPAAIHVHGGSAGVTFTGCTFTRMGASAVMFSGGSSHGSVINSTFTDLSGSAVMLGQVDDWAEKDETKQNRGFVLAHNTVSRTSLEYRGSPGITAAYVRDTVIENNEISNLSYSGVSIVSRCALLRWCVFAADMLIAPQGWGWGREDSYARNNTVRFNHIHHHMWVSSLHAQAKVSDPAFNLQSVSLGAARFTTAAACTPWVRKAAWSTRRLSTTTTFTTNATSSVVSTMTAGRASSTRTTTSSTSVRKRCLSSSTATMARRRPGLNSRRTSRTKGRSQSRAPTLARPTRRATNPECSARSIRTRQTRTARSRVRSSWRPPN